MRISAAGVVRSAALSAGLCVLLIVLVAGASNGLARANVPDGPVFVVVTALGAAALVYAGVIGGRAAKRADLDRREITLTAVVGCAVGFVALVMLNLFLLVIALGQQLTFAWSMLYGVLPWLACGAVGGWLASRPPRRARSKKRKKPAAA